MFQLQFQFCQHNKIITDPQRQHTYMHSSTPFHSQRQPTTSHKPLSHSQVYSKLCTNSLTLPSNKLNHQQISLGINIQHQAVLDQYTQAQQHHVRLQIIKNIQKIQEKPFGILCSKKQKDVKYNNIAANDDDPQKIAKAEAEKRIQISFINSKKQNQSAKLPYLQLEIGIPIMQDYQLGIGTEAIKIVSYDNLGVQQSLNIPSTQKKLYKQRCILSQSISTSKKKTLCYKPSHKLSKNKQQQNSKSKVKNQRFANTIQKMKITDSLIEKAISNYRLSKQNEVEVQKTLKSGGTSTKKSIQYNKEKLNKKQIQVKLQLQKQKKSYTKIKLADYFSKSPSRKNIKSVQTCKKYQKHLEIDKKHRFIDQAWKIPGIKNNISIFELQSLYDSFRYKKLPQYKWVEYVTQKTKSPSKVFIVALNNTFHQRNNNFIQKQFDSN